MNDQTMEQRLGELEGRLGELAEENRRLQTATDVHEIQNVMSRHEYFHGALMHEEELDAIWSKTTDDVAFEEAMFGSRVVGMADIRAYYVDFMRNTMFRAALDLTRSFAPHLADDPEDELPFGMSFMHTLTTPVIEVAADRETAKGVWISPGYTTLPSLEKLVAYWHWDRYGVDFIREDGQWKIWHFFVGREFTCAYDKSWVDTALDGEDPYEIAVAALADWDGFSTPPAPARNTFNPYSPYDVPTMKPRLPEPYTTFADTFSY